MTTPERMLKVGKSIKYELDYYYTLNKLHISLLELHIVESELFLKIAGLNPTNDREEKIKQRKIKRVSAQMAKSDDQIKFIVFEIGEIEKRWIGPDD